MHTTATYYINQLDTKAQKPRLLFIDNDEGLCDLIKANIDHSVFATECFKSGKAALERILSDGADLVVMDVVLPDMSGIDLLERIKQVRSNLPVIFIASKSELDYKLKSFEAGADDYVVKPFNFTELIYRMRAVLRRYQEAANGHRRVYKLGNYLFDLDSRKLTTDAEEKVLSIKESELLGMLCHNYNRMVSREDFLLKIWGRNDEFAVDSMDVYLSRVRKYLKSDTRIKIENLRGTGFKLYVEEVA